MTHKTPGADKTAPGAALLFCLLHGQRDALFLLVHIQHHHLHHIAHADSLGGVLEELVADLGDMNQAILVDTDINKHTKVDNITDSTGK